MEDRLAKSLRAAHDRHAQHLNASQTPPVEHASHYAPADEHVPTEHHIAEQHSTEHHGSEHHGSEHHGPAHHAQQHPCFGQHGTAQHCGGHEGGTELHSAALHQPHNATAEHHVHATPADHHVPIAAQAHHDHAAVAIHHVHVTAAAQTAPRVQAPSHQSHVSQPAAVAHVPTAAVPVVTPAPAYIAPARTPVAGVAALRNRLNMRGGRVSIVGTVLLSVLISTGIFSLQMISKWRRPKAAEPVAKSEGLDQPLKIASTQDDTQPSDEPAASPKQSPVAQAAADADPGDQRGMDEFFANNHHAVASTAPSAHEEKNYRAPYAPDPVDLSDPSQPAANARTVMAPEAAADHGSLAATQPTSPPGYLAEPAGLDQQPASNPNTLPAPQTASADPVATMPSPLSLSQSSEASGLPVPKQRPEFSRPANANVADWKQPAAPVAAPQVANTADGLRNTLDAPGPVILPGRATGPGAPVSAAAVPAVVPAAATVDATPLRDLSQPAPAAGQQVASAAASVPQGVDPVTGLYNHGPNAALPDAAHPEDTSALVPLDRTKVMSFQFRNAPWTVVLSQFAAETHLELRMQQVPQGVFNRWDSARYSPSQTLAILNSEIARTGCRLALEGNVLRVCALAPAAPASPTQSASSAGAWVPPASGVVPVSGRY